MSTPNTLVRHWKEGCDVRIDRSGPWGNPFSHKTGTLAQVTVATERDAQREFKNWLLGKAWGNFAQLSRLWMLQNLYQLRDKTLGCWGCQYCHGAVLSSLAHSPQGDFTGWPDLDTEWVQLWRGSRLRVTETLLKIRIVTLLNLDTQEEETVLLEDFQSPTWYLPAVGNTPPPTPERRPAPVQLNLLKRSL